MSSFKISRKRSHSGETVKKELKKSAVPTLHLQVASLGSEEEVEISVGGFEAGSQTIDAGTQTSSCCSIFIEINFLKTLKFCRPFNFRRCI